MGDRSAIEWTDATWNPVTGCTKLSAGCQNCYAERMAKRLQAMGSPAYEAGFSVTAHSRLLGLPLRWKSPRKVFVNSMSDLFHEDVPSSFIGRVFHVMVTARHHTFQALTKRSARMRDLSSSLPWPDNVWMGVTVEQAEYCSRMDDLRHTPASVKFVSFEPLLGPIHGLDLSGISWVIVGGESGPKARPMARSWVESIRDQCLTAQVPFFFKQWGGADRKRAGRVLDGRTWDEMPEQPTMKTPLPLKQERFPLELMIEEGRL